VEERRRVEEEEEEQNHRKDPGFARPITLAKPSSSRVGDLCGCFAKFSFSRLGGGREDGGRVDLAAHEKGAVRLLASAPAATSATGGPPAAPRSPAVA
jgi:hypothetical protein